MSSENSHSFDRQREIFLDAQSLPENERSAFLEHACAGDLELRAAVEELLANDAEDTFLMEPAAAPRPAMSERTGSRIDRYELVEEIGRGGMGVVFLARQEEPVKREVALKVIKAGMDTDEIIARFEIERQALTLMDHPNIARVLDAGSTPSGRPFFVMERVKGFPITRFADLHKLPTRNRLELFIEVCGAVQHAHQKGIIHRDLKPTNILVAMNGDRPIPKIIDFGVAKATTGELTQRAFTTRFHQLIGTPVYMSPEQISGPPEDLDTRSDVYSLGVLLYELLTGERPFDVKELAAQGEESMWRIIQENDPPKPSTCVSNLTRAELMTAAERRGESPSRLASRLRGDLDWITLKALEKDRNRRYATANALALDVQRHLNEEPVAAAAPGAIYKARKFVRRNRGATVSALLVAGAIILGLSLTLRSNVKERVARALAEESAREALRQKYASDLKVALMAWRESDEPLIESILRANVPLAGEPDLRGWLWRYLHGQLRQELQSARIHDGSIAVAVSPDGRQIAVAGVRADASAIDILDAETLEIRQTLPHPGGHLPGMWFSEDGTRLIVEPSARTSALRYDLITGEREDWPTESGWIQRLTKDGRRLVRLSAADRSVRGRKYVLSSSDTKAPGRTLAEKGPYILSNPFGLEKEFQLSPDGERVALACVDPVSGPVLRLFAVPGLDEIESIAVPGEITAIAWSPDSQTVATGYNYPLQVDIWSVAGDHSTMLEGSMHSPCTHLRFSPDGGLLASTELSSLIRIWNVKDGSLPRVYAGHDGCLAFFPDSRRLVTAGHGTVKVWDTSFPDDTELRRISLDRSLWNVAYSPDGALLATSAADGVVRLFDTRTGRLRTTLGDRRRKLSAPLVGNPDARLRFSPDGSILAVANPDAGVSVFDVASGAHRFDLPHPARVDDLGISPDGKLIATAGNDSKLFFWDLEAGELEFTIDDGALFYSVAFSPDPDSRLVAFGHDGETDNLVLMHLDTRARRSVSTVVCGSLTFSPDGKTLACGLSGAVELYEVPSLTLVETVRGARGPVPNASFSADGSTLAIPCWGGFVQLWNRKVRAEVGRFQPSSKPDRWLISAKFSPDGNTLAVSTLEEGIHLYEAPSMEDIGP